MAFHWGQDQDHVRHASLHGYKCSFSREMTSSLLNIQFLIAPEVLCQDWYTHAVDWWSLGVLMYALLQGTVILHFEISLVTYALFSTLWYCMLKRNQLRRTIVTEPLTFLQFPFREMSGEQTELEFGEPDLAEPARRLVRNLLTRDPRQRLRSLRTLQNHAFYHHFDFEKLQSKQVRSVLIPILRYLEKLHKESI